MENSIFQAVIFTKETLWTINAKAMVRCSGQMAHFTKVTGKQEFKTEKDKFT